jgi:low temperature requirement protein LtrA
MYFDWFKEALEHDLSRAAPTDLGGLVRDAYSLGHFPLVFGIIGYAVAVEEIMLHPDEPAPRSVLVALAGGVALFNLSTVFAYWRLHRQVLVTRLAITTVIALVVVAFPSWPPFWPLLAVAVGLLILAVLEGDPSRSHPHRAIDQPAGF